MCFLGASLGAPGGPPAGSLGGPRGHWRDRVGSQLRYYPLLGAPSHPPKKWKYKEICAFIMCISYVHQYVQNNMCGSNWLWTQLIMNPIDYELSVGVSGMSLRIGAPGSQFWNSSRFIWLLSVVYIFIEFDLALSETHLSILDEVYIK